MKDTPGSTPGPPDNSSGPKAVQQRRSSRKRNRQERDGEGASGAKPPGKRAGTPTGMRASTPPGKRAGTPHGTASARDSSVSRQDTGKATDASDVPRDGTPALAEAQEPSVSKKVTRGGRAKKGAKAEKAKVAKGAARAAASCDSEFALEQVKAEPKTSAAAPVTEKESSAPNGAAAGEATPGDQEHDSSVLTSSAQEQWVTLNGALDVLAIAPDDEVVAEIISLQAELLQVFPPSMLCCIYAWGNPSRAYCASTLCYWVCLQCLKSCFALETCTSPWAT